MAKQSTHKWLFSEAQLAMIPELRFFVDGQAPMDDLQEYLRFQRGWPTVIAVVISVLVSPPLMLLLYKGIGFGIVPSVAVLIGVNLLLSWWLLGMLFPALRRRQIRDALRERLQASGIYPCRVCAYDLRGSPKQCPECGALSAPSTNAVRTDK